MTGTFSQVHYNQSGLRRKRIHTFLDENGYVRLEICTKLTGIKAHQFAAGENLMSENIVFFLGRFVPGAQTGLIRIRIFICNIGRKFFQEVPTRFGY